MAHEQHEIFRTDRPWVTQAACTDEVSERFFGESGPPKDQPTAKLQQQWDEAKEICWTCPVLNQCRRDTLGEEYGVWGGVDQHQRWKARQALSRRIAGWPVERRIKLGQRLAQMRDEQALPWAEIRRITGINQNTALMVVTHWREWLEGERETSGLHVAPVRRNARKLSAAQKQRIIAMRSGLERHTFAQIADEMGVSDRTISRFINQVRPDLMPPGALTDFPANRGSRDAWVRIGSTFKDADYLGQAPDGVWFLFRIRTGTGGFTQKWFRGADVRFHRPVAVVIRERRAMDGKKVESSNPGVA